MLTNIRCSGLGVLVRTDMMRASDTGKGALNQREVEMVLIKRKMKQKVAFSKSVEVF